MGARQSKRSVDITTTPKKDGEVAVAEGEGKLEKIGDAADLKAAAATNGSLPHTDTVEEKDENSKDSTAEKDAAPAAAAAGSPVAAEAEVKENGVAEPETATEEAAAGDQLNESALSSGEKTPEGATDGKTEETEGKKKDKKKKKWSFRSISFSKKDKSKPTTTNKEGEKNGDVKEVAEENAEEAATSPTVESPKTEEPKSAEEPPKAAEPVLTNGDASPAEVPTKPSVEEPKPVVEEPPKDEPKEETKEESKAEEPEAKVEEKPVTKEVTKEVLTESNEVRQEDTVKDNDTAVKTEAAVVEE